MSLSRKLTGELLGTLLFVLAGCGTSLLDPQAGALAVALAYGLALAAAGYAFGPDGHFNPALTLGFLAAGRYARAEAIPVMSAQIAGAIIGATLVFGIAHGIDGFDVTRFPANGYGAHSPEHYGTMAVLLAEAAGTALFIAIVLGATTQRLSGEFAPLVMGLGFAALMLVLLPVDGGGLNPARSTAAALYQGEWALSELWAFWVLPFAGAALGGLAHRWMAESPVRG